MSDDGTSGNTIGKTDTWQYCPCLDCTKTRSKTAPGKWVWVPNNHGFYTFPIPATPEDARDDATKILDAMAGPLRGAAAHVQDLIDHDERNDIDG